jgi:hypothetical protein
MVCVTLQTADALPDLLNGVNYIGDETFEDIFMPTLEGGLVWDLSSLYVD